MQWRLNSYKIISFETYVMPRLQDGWDVKQCVKKEMVICYECWQEIAIYFLLRVGNLQFQGKLFFLKFQDHMKYIYSNLDNS